MDPICVEGLQSLTGAVCTGRVCLGLSAVAFSHLWPTEQRLLAVTSHQGCLYGSEQAWDSRGERAGPDLDEAMGRVSSTSLSSVVSHPLPPQVGLGFLLVEGVSGEVTGIGRGPFFENMC